MTNIQTVRKTGADKCIFLCQNVHVNSQKQNKPHQAVITNRYTKNKYQINTQQHIQAHAMKNVDIDHKQKQINAIGFKEQIKRAYQQCSYNIINHPIIQNRTNSDDCDHNRKRKQQIKTKILKIANNTKNMDFRQQCEKRYPKLIQICTRIQKVNDNAEKSILAQSQLIKKNDNVNNMHAVINGIQTKADINTHAMISLGSKLDRSKITQKNMTNKDLSERFPKKIATNKDKYPINISPIYKKNRQKTNNLAYSCQYDNFLKCNEQIMKPNSLYNTQQLNFGEKRNSNLLMSTNFQNTISSLTKFRQKRNNRPKSAKFINYETVLPEIIEKYQEEKQDQLDCAKLNSQRQRKCWHSSSVSKKSSSNRGIHTTANETSITQKQSHNKYQLLKTLVNPFNGDEIFQSASQQKQKKTSVNRLSQGKGIRNQINVSRLIEQDKKTRKVKSSQGTYKTQSSKLETNQLLQSRKQFILKSIVNQIHNSSTKQVQRKIILKKS